MKKKRSTISAISETARRKIAMDRVGSRNARARDFYFLSASRELLVRGRNFSSRGCTGRRRGKKRRRSRSRSGDDVAEQGDGDEVHLTEGTTDGG